MRGVSSSQLALGALFILIAMHGVMAAGENAIVPEQDFVEDFTLLQSAPPQNSEQIKSMGSKLASALREEKAASRDLKKARKAKRPTTPAEKARYKSAWEKLYRTEVAVAKMGKTLGTPHVVSLSHKAIVLAKKRSRATQHAAHLHASAKHAKAVHAMMQNLSKLSSSQKKLAAKVARQAASNQKVTRHIRAAKGRWSKHGWALVKKALEPSQVAVEQADRALKPSAINTEEARLQAKAALIFKTMIAKSKGRWQKLKETSHTLELKLKPLLHHGLGKKIAAKAQHILHKLKVLRIQEKLLHNTLNDEVDLRTRALHQAQYALKMAREVNKQSKKRRIQAAYASAAHVSHQPGHAYSSAWTLEHKIASTTHNTEKRLYESHRAALRTLSKGTRELRRIYREYRRKSREKWTKHRAKKSLHRTKAQKHPPTKREAASKKSKKHRAIKKALAKIHHAKKRGRKALVKKVKALKKAGASRKKIKKAVRKLKRKLKKHVKKLKKHMKKVKKQAKKLKKHAEKKKKRHSPMKKVMKKTLKKALKKAKLSKTGQKAFEDLWKKHFQHGR